MTDVPALVTVHLWGVRRRDVPRAVAYMGLHRDPLRRTPGLRFGKLLGTGNGRTFTLRDSDPRHWGVLATWASPEAAAAFERSGVVQAWGRRAEERLRIALRPLASRGTWGRVSPFGDPTPTRHDGAVAAITRARIAPRRSLTFWRAVPPVSADLQRVPGLCLAVGIGEAPIGLQGTFSLWRDDGALRGYAYGRAPHVQAIRRTAEVGWYAEELFARFAVVDVEGRYEGREVSC